MVWPASEADKARDDGEQLGEAVTQLYEADSQSEVDAALAEVDEAVTKSAEHGGDAVAEQATRQDARSTSQSRATSAPSRPRLVNRTSTRPSSTSR